MQALCCRPPGVQYHGHRARALGLAISARGVAPGAGARVRASLRATATEPGPEADGVATDRPPRFEMPRWPVGADVTQFHADDPSFNALVGALDAARGLIGEGELTDFYLPILWDEKGRKKLLIAALKVWDSARSSYMRVPGEQRITLVTGPRGSGKSKSIKAMLQALHLVTARDGAEGARVLGGYYGEPLVVYVRDESRMFDGPPHVTGGKGMSPVVVPPVLLVAEVLRAHGVEGVGGVASTSVEAGVPRSLCWSPEAFDTGALVDPELHQWLCRKKVLPTVAVDEFTALYEVGDGTWHEQLKALTFAASHSPLWFLLSGSSATAMSLLLEDFEQPGQPRRAAMHPDRVAMAHIGPINSKADLVWMLKNVMWPRAVPKAIADLTEESSHLEANGKSVPLADMLLTTSGVPRRLEMFVSGLARGGAELRGTIMPAAFYGEESAVPIALALACETSGKGRTLSPVLADPFSDEVAQPKFMVTRDELVAALGKVMAVSQQHGLNLRWTEAKLDANLLKWVEGGALCAELGSAERVSSIGFGNVGTAAESFGLFGPLLNVHPEVIRQMTTPTGTEAAEYGEAIFLASLCDRTVVGEGRDAVEWNHLGLLLKEHGVVCPSLGDGPIVDGGPTVEQLIEKIGALPLRWTAAKDVDQVAALADPVAKRATLGPDDTPEPGVLYAVKSDSGSYVLGWLLVEWAPGLYTLLEIYLQLKKTGRAVKLGEKDALDAAIRIGRVRFTTAAVGQGDKLGEKIREKHDVNTHKVPVTGILTNREPAGGVASMLLERATPSAGKRDGVFWIPTQQQWGSAPPPFFTDVADAGGSAGPVPPGASRDWAKPDEVKGTHTVDLVHVAETGSSVPGALVPHGGIGLLATPAEMKPYWCAPVRLLAHELGLESFGGALDSMEKLSLQRRLTRLQGDALALLAKTFKSEQQEAAEREQLRRELAKREADTELERRKAELERRKAELERVQEQRKAEQEQRKAEQEQRKAEQEQRKAEQEQRKAEQEQRKAEQEQRKAEHLAQAAITKAGLSPEVVAHLKSGGLTLPGILRADDGEWREVMAGVSAKWSDRVVSRLDVARAAFKEEVAE